MGDNEKRSESLSNQAATDLLGLLLSRGYLHSNSDNDNGGGGSSVDIILADPQRGNPNHFDEADNNNNNKEDAPIQYYSENDDNCQLVLLANTSTNSSSNDSATKFCITLSMLESRLMQELEQSGGRSSMKTLTTALDLKDETPLLRILFNQKQQKSATQQLFQLGEDIYSSLYMDRITQGIFVTLLSKDGDNPSLQQEKAKGVKQNGFALLSDLAMLDYHVPMDVAVAAVSDRISGYDSKGSLKMVTFDAGPAIVSEIYLTSLQKNVIEVFSNLQEPAIIADVCHGQHWDVGLVAPRVEEACRNKSLPGEIHGGGLSEAGGVATTVNGSALYTPHAHVQALRQAVDDHFAVQGWMTASKAALLGLSKSKMGEFIQVSFPGALVVSESLVVNPEIIVQPLEAILEEAIATNSFADLVDHLPVDILDQEQDARILFDQHIIPKLAVQIDSKIKKKNKQSSIGMVVLSSSANGGMFVSKGMIVNIEKKLLPNLIARYAKERAEEIEATELAGDSTRSKSSKAKGGGRKGKKSGKQGKDDSTEEAQSEDVVPLLEVVQDIAKEYQDVLIVDPTLKDGIADAKANGSVLHLDWESTADEGQIGGTSSCGEGLVSQFCREAFYSEDLLLKCKKAIEVELKRLHSARVSKASVSRKDAATKVRNREGAFEEAFVAYCYLIQSQAKFLEYVKGCDGENTALVETLTAEFLQGSCSELTRNLTQYCLFKNEMDLDMFHFVPDDTETNSEHAKESNDSTLPLYCLGPSMDTRRSPQTILRLNESYNSINDDQTSNAKEPLVKLRDILPNSIGVALARQWVMCGGNSYQGGTKIDDDGNPFVRPGDLEKLIAHLEENCLSLCGFPFKKLDKKSEKQFLFARRQSLLKSLEEQPPTPANPSTAKTVLDVTILLLFQQAKNVVAFGSSLYPDLLQLLTLERKISDEVAGVLTKLAEEIGHGGEGSIDSTLIETVRACGACRDISKYEVES